MGAVAGVAAVAITLLLPGDDGGAEPPPSSTTSDSVTTSTGPTTTTTTPPPAPSAVHLAVHNWCACSGPRGLATIKVKLEIRNDGSVPIQVGSATPSTIRLILNDPTGDWSSPWATDGVSLVSLDPAHPIEPGQTSPRETDAWAVIPNPDGAYEPFEDGGVTFVTHWPANLVLEPGESYFDPAIKEGDLVFYAPPANGGVAIIGIGVLSGPEAHDLIGFLPVEEWSGDGSDPNAF